MASAKSTIPSYRLHKATGQAVVTIDGKDRYLGKHGTPESRLRYERIITQRMQSGTVSASDFASGDGITVAELCLQYLRHATAYYVKDGKPTSELKNVKRAIKTLRETYASLPASEFGPLKLKHVRQRFVETRLSRVNCNRFTKIVIRIFAWGVSEELLPPGIAHGLREVKGLSPGRCGAPETDPVQPIDDETVRATMEHLPDQIKAMVRIQELLACRPGELVGMRPCDIDMSKDVWIYTPPSHKTQHHGKTRIIPIGPRAQLLLQPWLPSFPGQHVWRSHRGSHLTVIGYRGAIRRACLDAGVPVWGPNRLRHNGASAIRHRAGIDAAQVILGHANVQVTQIYAERNIEAACRVAAAIG
jgi:integrase